MRPSFGTLIRATVFEPGDTTTLNDLRSSILNAIANFEARITVSELQLVPDFDNNRLFIRIFGNLNRSETNRNDFFFEVGIPVEVAG